MPNNMYGSRESRPYAAGSGDHGAGSSSDQDTRYSRTYRAAFVPHNPEDPSTLKETIKSLDWQIQHLRAELQQKENAVRELMASSQELASQRRGAMEHNGVLQDNLQRAEAEKRQAWAEVTEWKDKYNQSKRAKKNAEKERDDLKTERDELKTENKDLKKILKRTSTSPPREQHASHLAERFERRQSRVMPATAPYIEPLGPAAPRMSRRNSVSGTRGYANVHVAERADPQYSTIPRNYHEPGDYIPYPVPSTRT